MKGWTVGQRVGVGFLGSACGNCDFCRNGDLADCKNQEFTRIHSDGGYAEVMLAKASGLVRIGDQISDAKWALHRLLMRQRRNASLAEAFLLLALGSNGLVQHSVQALDEGGGILQRHAFEQQRLVEEEPRGVFYHAVAGIG